MHLFQSKSFTASQEADLRRIARPAEYCTDFLTPDEFDQCRRLVMSVDSWPEHGQVSKYWGFGLDDASGQDLSWLWEKIHTMFPQDKLDFFAVQEGINPWKIHADIRWYADRVPHRVFLLPMDVEPMSGNVNVNQWPETHTITFNQRNFLSRWDADKIDKGAQYGNDQSGWKRPIEDVQIEGLVDGYHVDHDTWQKYFSHVPYNHLEGLTVDCINLWQPRAMMHWDNTALHCADDFLGHGIRTKRCFMVFTVLKQ